jgi:hypothetical protein
LSEPRRLGFHEHWIDHAALFIVGPQVSTPLNGQGMQLTKFSSSVAANVEGQ